MITLHKEDYEKMLAYARAEAPIEACGLIAGTRDGDDRHIEFVYILTNIDRAEEHFSLDPREQLAAVKDMRAHGWVPLGNWHSHPVSPARPSQEDIRLAYDSTASYLILSLMNEANPVLHAFHIEGNEAQKEPLIIESSAKKDGAFS